MKISGFRSFFVVLRKELTDIFRDRRTMWNVLLISPLMFPLLMVVMGSLVNKRVSTQLEQPIVLNVVNRDAAPNLMTYLAARGIQAVDAPKDYERQIRDQTIDLGLVVSEDYASNFRKGQPAKIEIVADSTRRNADMLIGRVKGALDQYSSQVGNLRLIARGIQPTLAMPVNVGNRDLAPAAAKRNQFLAVLLPYFLMLTAFIGGAPLLFEATAGEREHQSMEPLLTTATRRAAIVSGKMAAAAVIGLISILLTLVAFKIAAAVGGPAARMMDVPVLVIGQLLLILAPLVVFGAALLTYLAARAKTMKEAQSFLVLLMLMPMIPGVMLMVNPLKEKLWQFAVPFLSQNQLIMKLLREEFVTPQIWGAYFLGSIAIAGLFWFLAVKRYDDERLAISG